MKRILFVVCLLALVAAFYIGSNNAVQRDGSHALAGSPAPSPSESKSPAGEILITPATGQRSERLRYDPVVITPCMIVAAKEQNVSSQVDGILEDVPVELGDKVNKGDLLARLHDQQIRAQTAHLKIRANSETAQRIAQAQHDEAESKVAYARKANESGLQSVPDLELKGYLFQKERFAQEIKRAREEQEIARKELEKTLVLLEQHQIRSGIEGEIVKVFKRPGEAVKQAEPLFRLANFQRLRIEGLCKASQADFLRIGATALVEPEVRGEQLTELAGHTGAVSALAVSPEGDLLASGSEDRSVMVWTWPQGRRLALLPHPAEVSAVAFAPGNAKAETRRLATGGGDGQLRLWIISAAAIKGCAAFSQAHEGAIRAIAFSHDGAWCATGAEDRRIGIWDAAMGKHLYWLEPEPDSSAHKGAVTSLSFTPDGYLASAGRDNCLKVWKIGAETGALVTQVSGRTGEVTQLSISPDGMQILFDHGDELRVLDRRNWDSLGAFRSQRQGRFIGLAQFSPSGRLVLTAASNGRIQLWKAPDAAQPAFLAAHSYEVRHFVPANSGPVTCGVFSRDEKVCFTAGADKLIRVWPVPPPTDWQQPLEAKISFIGNQVERGTDTVRIRADMDNPVEPGRRLRAGTFATLRIYLDAAN